MLRKLISVRNVGRFRNSAAIGNPDLCRYTLILGANGFGKTTLCAVLRSLKTGDPALITGRRTLGVEESPTIELLFAEGRTRFDGTTWTATYPSLAIFDEVFVAENVHSGEVVEIDHRRNLYRIIIGEQGVRLTEKDVSLAGQSRQKTGQISDATRGIRPHLPVGLSLDAFLALPADGEIDARIAEQERTVEAIREARQLIDRPPLAEIEVPSLPDEFLALLASTIDDIAQDAETRLAEHLAVQGMDADGGSWIAEGLEHADGETCPFCGQDIDDLPLVAAFRAVFSERYNTLQARISDMHRQIDAEFGEAAIGRLNVRAQQNNAAVEFWSRYCTFDPAPLKVTEDIPDTMRALRVAAMTLLDRKGHKPLEAIQRDDNFRAAAARYEIAQAKVRQISDSIRNVNALISAKKEETGAANVLTAQTELARRRAVKVRHSEPIARLCVEYARLIEKKAQIDRRKGEIRAQLNAYTLRMMRPYEQRINEYLDSFNAGFRITETMHGYPGGTAASTYRLLIDNYTVDVGDGRTPTSRPSFKNTLSSGDRTTLALAFFLAHIEQDQELPAKTVVFDDPFGSQDAFRRRQTVHEIAKVGGKCAQAIVLSHDATFLKQVWDKAPTGERVALSLADHRVQGMKIVPVDLERACQGRTATDIDALLTYLTTGTGTPVDLIRKMRTVLETHCWITYPASFQNGQNWLGEIVSKIREGGDQHPAQALYDELDQINEYTREHHHGEDLVDARHPQIDTQELTGYIKRTLRIVNALQA